MYHDDRVTLDVVVGLGSNLGDRAATLASAVRAIDGLDGTKVVAESALVETEPVGGPPQGRYLNGAVRVSTELSPRALLDGLLAIERSHGRERRERWGPRTLDLDVLWIAGLAIDVPGLVVPHPRLVERPFALMPLLEVAPDATHPLTAVAYASLAPV